ncbi:acyl-CoA thioesterase [Oscillospiraceae bacterium CM]|nr:acyl-CoA thioesterase [Oscillospiraceae bacterium CM]
MISETRLTVRYAETDKMGIVHHSNYPIWFEAGRTDFLKKLGFSYSEVEKRGILLPLYEITCRFKHPAYYEDEIRVLTSLLKLSGVRLVLAYEVKNRDDLLLATGETLHAFTDKALKPVNAERAAPALFNVLKSAGQN